MTWVLVNLHLLLLIFVSSNCSIIDDLKKTQPPVVAVKKCDRPCYNGVCRNGTCLCSAGWKGAQCESCYGRIKLTNSRGFITEGPGNYSRNLRCSWLLDGKSAGAQRISLKLDSFVTECGWDNVFLFDGDGMHGRQLAALSGIMTPTTDLSSIEYTADSGQAFLYFYSDLAYNMSGFNISYKFDGCPGDCNGRGECEKATGLCRCNHNYTGTACEIPSCLRRCKYGKCQQLLDICDCDQGWHGPNCNVRLGKSAWETVSKESGGAGRASHAAVVEDGQMFVIGGYHFQGANFSAMMTFDFSTSSWSSVPSESSSEGEYHEELSVNPMLRYDHSLVSYQGDLYMFGGVVEEKNVSCELWAYNLKNKTFRLVTEDHFDHTSAPYHAAGHTAHVVGNAMVVIFGYNQYRGYMNVIQEYYFNNNSWHIPTTSGTLVPGAYGHSSVYDSRTQSIFVYGGFYANGQTLGLVSDRLFEYRPALRRWRLMQSSGYPVFRHAAGILNGVMLIVGGNAHNESMPSRQTKCYADKVLVYDIECETWYTLDSPNYISPGVGRYGHVMVNNNGLYVYGGFNGRMLDDVVKFIPGECSYYKHAELCWSSKEGSKCVWSKARCLSWSEAEQQSRIGKVANSSAATFSKACRYEGVGRGLTCKEVNDCLTCTTFSFVRNCVWCDGKCVKDCEDAKKIVRSEECPRTADLLSCQMYHTCVSCKSRRRCVWNLRSKPFPQCISENEGNNILTIDDGKKDAVAAILAASEVANVCPPPCSFHEECNECTLHACMWCSTMGRCVDINSYLAAFPYGQCTQWVSSGHRCTNPSDCSFQQTCDSCQSVGPRCGWCDDGSGTGLGECLPGGLEGPVEFDPATKTYQRNLGLCSGVSDRWFFFRCPACQCNGHGHCQNMSSGASPLQELKCESCSGNTVGSHCETCAEGYYGNALNGGNCTECMCNEQATDCDPYSGECYCTTKGVSGTHCDKCDQKYVGDPRNRTCYYELSVDFIFTFRLDADDPKDRYVSKINFITKPAKKDTDVTFKLTCSRHPAKVNLSVYSGNFRDYPGMKRKFLANTPCSEIERRFSHDEFEFGTDANTTFFVYLYDFRTPVDIQISFAQTPPIDWIRFFITFALYGFKKLLLFF